MTALLLAKVSLTLFLIGFLPIKPLLYFRDPRYNRINWADVGCLICVTLVFIGMFGGIASTLIWLWNL